MRYLLLSNIAVYLFSICCSAQATINPPLYHAEQFVSSGSDASIEINACIAAVIAAGGGTCDARALGGTQVMSQEVDVGSSTQAASGTTGVTLLLPPSAVWEFNITNGTSCGIKQFSNTAVIGLSTAGLANRMFLAPYNNSSNMDSLYCTDLSPSGGGSYIRASGFAAHANLNSVGGSFKNGAIHVHEVLDESLFSFIAGFGYNGDGWHIDSACCGTSFDHITAVANSGGGGYPIIIGGGYYLPTGTLTNGSPTITGVVTTGNSASYANLYVAAAGVPSGTTVVSVTSNSITMSANATGNFTTPINLLNSTTCCSTGLDNVSFNDSTFNYPGVGFPNALVSGHYGNSQVLFKNVYMEPNASDTTSPFIIQADANLSNQFINVGTNSGSTTKYLIESHTTFPWNASGLYTRAGINDFASGASVIVPPLGAFPYQGILTYPYKVSTYGGLISFGSQYGPAQAYTTFFSATGVTITRVSMFMTSAPSCTTYPVFEIYDATASAAVSGTAITLNGTNHTYDTGAIAAQVQPGHILEGYWANTASCTAYPPSPSFTATLVN